MFFSFLSLHATILAIRGPSGRALRTKAFRSVGIANVGLVTLIGSAAGNICQSGWRRVSTKILLLFRYPRPPGFRGFFTFGDLFGRQFGRYLSALSAGFLHAAVHRYGEPKVRFGFIS